MKLFLALFALLALSSCSVVGITERNERLPASSCSFDSDCNGGACRSGKCSNVRGGTCKFDSDCPGGACRRGKCSNNR